MVRAVKVHVTVDAAFVVDESHRGRVGRLGRRGAVRGRVTLLAEPRTRDLEQLLLVAAVRVVAVRAVLDNRSMLIQKRTALLSVAAEAGLIHRAREKQFLIGRA